MHSMSNPAENIRTLVIEREFAHPPEKIWRALTESPLVAQWLMDNDLEPLPGHRFHFRSKPMPYWDGMIDCEVLIVEAGKKLSYTWNALGLESVVVWTLAPTDGGTLVRMEQSGFRPDQDAAYKGATYGWQGFIGRLEPVVAGLQ